MRDVAYFHGLETPALGCWAQAGYTPRGAWKAAHGDIPKGMHVRHSCDNAQCVRPSHLMLRKGPGTK